VALFIPNAWMLRDCVDSAATIRDFGWGNQNANEWYKNLDKLIEGVNADGRINVFYSTPSQYVDAVHAANYTWTVKTDDFFPCSSCVTCLARELCGSFCVTPTSFQMLTTRTRIGPATSPPVPLSR
jgi:hypothetical protein